MDLKNTAAQEGSANILMPRPTEVDLTTSWQFVDLDRPLPTTTFASCNLSPASPWLNIIDEGIAAIKARRAKEATRKPPGRPDERKRNIGLARKYLEEWRRLRKEFPDRRLYKEDIMIDVLDSANIPSLNNVNTGKAAIRAGINALLEGGEDLSDYISMDY